MFNISRVYDLLLGNDWMQKTPLQLRAGIGCHQIIHLGMEIEQKRPCVSFVSLRFEVEYIQFRPFM